MDYNKIMKDERVSFAGIEDEFFLIGLLSAFDNGFQAKANASLVEISWKQMFAMVCIDLCRKPPTINELAGVMETSHQNVKQILLKLEKKNFVRMVVDEKDKRKQRVIICDEARAFFERTSKLAPNVVSEIFDGISKEALITTIQTIIMMNENLKGKNED